jgi:sugar transferase (PEP-CTERM/EpsH1 system associated)
MHQEAAQTTALRLISQRRALAAPSCAAMTAGTVRQRDGRTRVTHISLGTNVGGMEQLLVQFARLADRARFELAFISLEGLGTLAPEIQNLAWPVYGLGKRPGLRPALVLRLAQRLRAIRPHVVQTHNTAAFFYGALAAYLARVPRLLHTQHGQRYMATRHETWLFRQLCRLAHRVIGVSDDAIQRTISAGVPVERTCVIHNGVDVSRFSYSGPDAAGPAMLVARLSPEKDVATLLHAVRHLANNLEPGSPALRLEIVGDGSDRPSLETLAHNLGLGDRVRFLGQRSDIAAILPRASMFVLPSLTEGISLTLLEAMARGLPVVATRVGGNPEVVVDGVTGFLVPPRDPVALAAAMARIRQRPVLAADMGLQGRRRVEQTFSLEQMIRCYEQQYLGDAEP